ncbi:MAG: hypothetical protein HY543_01905 [Deltaproteobacteria bacterium]|nr:hypothetical protein [Deltaproteobacteria bacterium]
MDLPTIEGIAEGTVTPQAVGRQGSIQIGPVIISRDPDAPQATDGDLDDEDFHEVTDPAFPLPHEEPSARERIAATRAEATPDGGYTSARVSSAAIVSGAIGLWTSPLISSGDAMTVQQGGTAVYHPSASLHHLAPEHDCGPVLSAIRRRSTVADAREAQPIERTSPAARREAARVRSPRQAWKDRERSLDLPEGRSAWIPIGAPFAAVAGTREHLPLRFGTEPLRISRITEREERQGGQGRHTPYTPPEEDAEPE